MASEATAAPADERTALARRRRDLLWVTAFTLLLHLPFLGQPVQGDEVYYLALAQNALEHPLTPLDFRYPFLGNEVDMAGHPHPPLNAYLLALLLAVCGGFSPLAFHAAYLAFPVSAGIAGYLIAERYTDRPLWAALLLASSPLLLVNTQTLAGGEAPMIAFLLCGAAAFLAGHFVASGVLLSLAALTGLQALAVAAILPLHYLRRRQRPPWPALAAAAAPFAALGAWQSIQWALIGRLPAMLLLGHITGGTFGRLGLKVGNAIALLQHLAIMPVFVPLVVRPSRRVLAAAVAAGLFAAYAVRGYPWWERALLFLFVAFGVETVAWLWDMRRRSLFLADWCLLYFAFTLAAFFAGAARYLLPLAAPLVILFVMDAATREAHRNLLRWALAINLLLAISISAAAYEFSLAYARVPPPPSRPFLVNSEWGLRFHMVERGGRILTRHSLPGPGEWIVSSELALGGRFDSLAEAAAVPVATRDLNVRLPLRLVDRYAHSGYSTVAFGLLPFSFSTRPLDRITYWATSPFLFLNADWVPTQFSGRLVYLPATGASIRLPLQPAWTRLRLALFARGAGNATFSVTDAAGKTLLDRTLPVDGESWEPHELDIAGQDELFLKIQDAPGLKAGWGELVAYRPAGEAGSEVLAGTASSVEAVGFSTLNMGDVRARAQLLSGFHEIEDGAWRWMAKDARAVLRIPQSMPSNLELKLFFPPGHMERAGGPVTVALSIDGRRFAEQTYQQPGAYTLSKLVTSDFMKTPTAIVTIQMNRAVPPGDTDQRELAAVVSRLGFTTPSP